MGYSDKLRELAAAYSISTGYNGFGGHYVDVSDDTLVKTLRAYGVYLGQDDMPDEELISQKIHQRQDELFARPLPATIVCTVGDPYVFNVHVHDGLPAEVTITLEDGSVRFPEQVDNWTPPRTIDGVAWGEASFRLPTDLPMGWHRITLRSDDLQSSAFLIVTPQRLSTTDDMISRPAHGVMAQIYSVRSEHSWGMGDFHDLGDLAETVAREAGADFLLINPLHAAEPLPPVEDSPYLPTTRRFVNPIYIRVEDIPELLDLPDDIQEEVAEIASEYRSLNFSSEIIERSPIYFAKLQVLREIYNSGRDAAREQEFQEYINREGQGLYDFARWCAREEIKATESERSAHSLPVDEDEASVFYMWLQWICDQQLAVAQSRALEAGMRIGIMADLAVGVHPGGADAHNLADVLAPQASVGAPPDNYNQQGQDWSQPPWHPERMAEQGYIAWRDLLRTVLRHSGGIRVDHILGLFRLFWIPRMQSPTSGTYVNYDFNAFVGILALEAERAGAVVIGEDLGTFEPWVQEVLASRGIMGTSILWFESQPEGGPRYKEGYRQAALSSVGTHDLPPTAGYLEGEHIKLREQLGILVTDVDQEEREDLQWQGEILNRVKEQGCFHGLDVDLGDFTARARGDRGDTVDLLVALHRFIAATPSALTCTSLVDMVADKRAQNQPGTVREQYPNWCIPLCDADGKAVTIEALAESDVFRRVAEASRRQQP